MASGIEPIKKGYQFLFEKKKLPTGVIGTVILFVLLVGVFSYSASSLEDSVLSMDEILQRLKSGGTIKGGDDPFPADSYENASAEQTVSDSSSENSDKTEAFTLSQENIFKITFTLTWTDEADASARHTNSPDEFGLAVAGPNGQSDEASMQSNTGGNEGRVELSFDVTHEKADDGNGTGDWEYTIKCGDCGNQEPIISFLGLRERSDTGNSWTLKISYEFHQMKAGE